MFFAFELLLALILLNTTFWITNFLSWTRILSQILLIFSPFIALSGFYCLKKLGKPTDEWENTTRLINRGIFRYIRHPLYSSLILLSLGILLRNVTLMPIILCSICMLFLITASLVEEKENLAKFGDAYMDYKETTRRYIPFIL